MQRKPKKVPDFKSEDAERRFWATHDSSEYLDWSGAQPARLPNLKPSTETISLRLPVSMLEDLKVLAHMRGVPHLSLLKVFLAERIRQEKNASKAS